MVKKVKVKKHVYSSSTHSPPPPQNTPFSIDKYDLFYNKSLQTEKNIQKNYLEGRLSDEDLEDLITIEHYARHRRAQEAFEKQNFDNISEYTTREIQAIRHIHREAERLAYVRSKEKNPDEKQSFLAEATAWIIATLATAAITYGTHSSIQYARSRFPTVTTTLE